MIIDSNAHITENGKWFSSEKNASVENLISSMALSGTEKSLLLPLPGITTNAYIKEVCKTYPEKFISGASFNPGMYDSAESAIKAFHNEINRADFKIVKFHNRLGGYAPDDEKFIAVLKSNNENEIPFPVAICGIFNDSKQPLSVVPPNLIFNLAQKFSNTRFLIMHGCGTWIFKTAEMVRDLKNVYLDLSFTISKYKGSSVTADIAWLCRNFDKRIVWGSDFPEYDLDQALNDFYEITAGIATNKIDSILGNNIIEFLA